MISFFLVSTLTIGIPCRLRDFTFFPITLNCVSRSGCRRPESLFTLAFSEIFMSFRSRPTVPRLIGCPWRAISRARFRVLLRVHRTPEMGSPPTSSFIRFFSSGRTLPSFFFHLLGSCASLSDSSRRGSSFTQFSDASSDGLPIQTRDLRDLGDASPSRTDRLQPTDQSPLPLVRLEDGFVHRTMPLSGPR